MTNEQIIAVVELWGWKWHPDGEVPSGNKWAWQGRWQDQNGRVMLYRRDCSKEVNSWQGFGRTVEVMAEKGYHFFNTHRSVAHNEFGRIIFKRIAGELEEKNIIKATHLAALEAVRQEKEDER